MILALGNSEWQNGWTAHENKDRMAIGLPGQQPQLVSAVLAAAKGKRKPIIAVLVNGGLASLDSLVAVPQQQQKLAIVEALLPGNTGATALANALWGRTNTFGKLPFTMYPASFVEASDFADLSMSNPPGRSYKYYTGDALYEFSAGLSYTTFKLSSLSPDTTVLAVKLDATTDNGESWPKVSVVVTNTGTRAGDECVFLWHNASNVAAQQQQQHRTQIAAPPVPLKQLVDFQRISLNPGESKTVEFQTSPSSVTTVDAVGRQLVLPGAHGLIVTRGAQHEAGLSLTLEVLALEPRVLSQLPL